MLTLAFYLLRGIRPLVLNYWGNFVLQGIYLETFWFPQLGEWRYYQHVVCRIWGTAEYTSTKRSALSIDLFSPWVMSSSLWLHGPYLARLFCPWDFRNKNTGVGCHFLLQRIFLTQLWNLHLLLDRQIFKHWATWEALLLLLLLSHFSRVRLCATP